MLRRTVFTSAPRIMIGNRLRSVASEVGPSLLSNGYHNAHVDQQQAMDLPPPVSHKQLSKMVKLARSALFPEFLNTGDATWRKVSQSKDVSPLLDELGSILLEQMKVAEQLENAEKIRQRQLTRSSSSAGSTVEEDPKYSAADDSSLLGFSNKHEATVAEFFRQLPKLQTLLNTDINAILQKDVATSSRAEVVTSYPSVYCMTHQRIAHELHLLGVSNLITRTITEIAHNRTGIDIHPNVSIGHHFFIDHGTGIVVGGTSVIGNHVTMFHGVTLGAKSFPTDEDGNRIKGLPRHPIVEDHVTLYASSTVLGRVTIGQGSIIGGNVCVMNDIAPHSMVVQEKPQVRHLPLKKAPAPNTTTPALSMKSAPSSASATARVAQCSRSE